MAGWLECEIYKYGYLGKFADLICYAGSIDCLSWYWARILKPLIDKSNGYYKKGSFIRYKIRDEAREKNLSMKASSDDLNDKSLKELITQKIKYKENEFDFKSDIKRFIKTKLNPEDKKVIEKGDFQNIDEILIRKEGVLKDFLNWKFG